MPTSYTLNMVQRHKPRATTSETTAACSSLHSAVQTKEINHSLSSRGVTTLNNQHHQIFWKGSLGVPLWLSNSILLEGVRNTVCHHFLINQSCFGYLGHELWKSKQLLLPTQQAGACHINSKPECFLYTYFKCKVLALLGYCTSLEYALP